MKTRPLSGMHLRLSGPLLMAILSVGLAAQVTGAQEAGTTAAPEATQPPQPPASPPAQAEPIATPAPVPPAPPAQSKLVGLSGLLMQPPYFALRFGVALVGAMTSGVVWIMPGENSRQNAQAVWEKTTRNYWGWPEFVGALSAPKQSE